MKLSVRYLCFIADAYFKNNLDFVMLYNEVFLILWQSIELAIFHNYSYVILSNMLFY